MPKKAKLQSRQMRRHGLMDEKPKKCTILRSAKNGSRSRSKARCVSSQLRKHLMELRNKFSTPQARPEAPLGRV
ncbi:hypothetical protein M378DRAFT_673580 [Amanita muscaria Koide BX008]|uniref:Uncharacterized protein n=1 Tax=Amanita muscaria (strain Koide BX008) TaxID=946122 RepID=A0A0C2X2A3_AMAMK|nr:hypothetical protein M378DRAFT_673580 [Amanita muscaria Koide BX008]